MNLDAITMASVSWALDIAAQRQQVLSHNIAHAAVPGHARLRLDFEAHVREARRQIDAHGLLDTASLSELRANHVAVLPEQAEGGMPVAVQLDAELTDMAHNAVHYHALAKGLARYLGILALAASEGRR